MKSHHQHDQNHHGNEIISRDLLAHVDRDIFYSPSQSRAVRKVAKRHKRSRGK